jgi:HK97 family phage major capsid protein
MDAPHTTSHHVEDAPAGPTVDDGLLEGYTESWRSASPDERLARSAVVSDRVTVLSGYAHRSQPQDDELSRLAAESVALDGLVAADTRAVQMDRIRAAAEDPANREGPQTGLPATPRSMPSRFRPAAAGDGIWRSRSAWQGLDESSFRAGNVVGRAYDALDSFRDESLAPGCGRIAELLGEESDERTEASQWAVALSDPAYYSAFRSVFRNPTFGSQYWNAEERNAMARVNRLSMRSGTLGTGSMGWALPLVLDPDIKLINAGQANPWRELSTIKLTTSSTWNGVTSSGATAAWLGEGAVSSDNTPTLGQLQITPYKMASWLFGSYESVGWDSNGGDGDVAFASQVNMLLADAKDRLEEATFSTGASGVANTPAGLLSAIGTATDTALGTGAWVGYGAGSLAAVKEAVPPRFRLGPGSKTAWIGSINYIDKMQAVPSFSGSLMPLVDQSGPQPRLLGSPIYESSSMATATAAGTRAVCYGDFSQNYIVDRWPSHVLFEPMVVGTGAGAQFPSGQSGWFFFARSGMGQTTTGAWRVGKN